MEGSNIAEVLLAIANERLTNWVQTNRMSLFEMRDMRALIKVQSIIAIASWRCGMLLN